MTDDKSWRYKDMQAAFMEALNGLKEYAKVNGNIVTKEDVNSYFKDMHLDDNKYSMITGYLMANGITIKGEDGTDNEFLHTLCNFLDSRLSSKLFFKSYRPVIDIINLIKDFS